MDQVSLSAEIREGTGKELARKLRKAGKIPGVIYGRGSNPINVSIDKGELVELMDTGKAMRSLVNLKVEGRAELSKKSMIFREIQRHFFNRSPLAVDLQLVDPERPVTIPVPIVLVGEPAGIKAGGVVQQLLRSVKITGKADFLPDELAVDISKMMPGDTFYVNRLSLPEGSKVRVGPKTPVCTMTIPRGLAMLEDEEEGEEGAEGEGAEGENAEAKTEE